MRKRSKSKPSILRTSRCVGKIVSPFECELMNVIIANSYAAFLSLVGRLEELGSDPSLFADAFSRFSFLKFSAVS